MERSLVYSFIFAVLIMLPTVYSANTTVWVDRVEWSSDVGNYICPTGSNFTECHEGNSTGKISYYGSGGTDDDGMARYELDQSDDANYLIACVDLTSYDAAYVNFSSRLSAIDSGEYLRLDVNKTGTGFTNVWDSGYGTQESYQNNSVDISSYIDSNTCIKFHAKFSGGVSDYVYFDDAFIDAEVTELTITVNSPENATIKTTNDTWFNVTTSIDASVCIRELDGTNATMDNSSTTVWYNLTENIADGSHTVKFYCNKTSGNWGTTQTRVFTLDVHNNITTFTSPVEPTDPSSYVKGTDYQFNITACDLDGASEIDDVIFEWESSNSTITDYRTINSTCREYYVTEYDLGAGTYSWKWYANDSYGDDATPNSDTFTIDKADNTVTIMIDGNPNQNVSDTYDGGLTMITVTAGTVDSELTNLQRLYINGSDKGYAPYSEVLAAGFYEIKGNISGTANYSTNATGATYYLNISKATSSISVSFTPSTNSTTFPTDAIIQCSMNSGDSGATLTLYRNGTSVSSGSGDRSVTENPGAGTWNYTCTYGASENYTTSTDANNYLTVGKKIPIVSLCNGDTCINNTGLIGYWKLESFNSTNYTKDYSGYGNDGNRSGSLLIVDGKYGNATYFDDDDDQIYTYKDYVSDGMITDQVTVVAWFYMEKQQNQVIAGQFKISPVNGTDIFGLWTEGCGPISWMVDNGTDQINMRSDVSVNESLNEWHHTAGTYNGTHTCLYRQGTLNKTCLSLTGNINNGTGGFTIGNRVHQLTPTVEFKGIIDEVMLWNRSLSASEIQMLFQTTKPYKDSISFNYTETNTNDTGLTYDFYINSTSGISNPYTEELSVGHNYFWLETYGNDNFTNITMPIIPLQTSKISPTINLYLNGVEGNITVANSTDVNITASLPSQLTVSVDANMTGWEIQSGSGSVENTTAWNASSNAKYNITAYTSGNANYTSASVTNWLSIGFDDLVIYSYSLNDSYINFDQVARLEVNISDAGVDTALAEIHAPSGTSNHSLSQLGNGNWSIDIGSSQLGSNPTTSPGTVNISLVYANTTTNETSNSTSFSFEYGLTQISSSISPNETTNTISDSITISTRYNTTEDINITSNCTIDIAAITYDLIYDSSTNLHTRQINTNGWSTGEKIGSISCTNSSYQTQTDSVTFIIRSGQSGSMIEGGGGGGDIIYSVGAAKNTSVYIVPKVQTIYGIPGGEKTTSFSVCAINGSLDLGVELIGEGNIRDWLDLPEELGNDLEGKFMVEDSLCRDFDVHVNVPLEALPSSGEIAIRFTDLEKGVNEVVKIRIVINKYFSNLLRILIKVWDKLSWGLEAKPQCTEDANSIYKADMSGLCINSDREFRIPFLGAIIVLLVLLVSFISYDKIKSQFKGETRRVLEKNNWFKYVFILIVLMITLVVIPV